MQTAPDAERALVVQADDAKAKKELATIERCMKIINELESDIAALMKSQEYYRRKMHEASVRRTVALNLRLI